MKNLLRAISNKKPLRRIIRAIGGAGIVGGGAGFGLDAISGDLAGIVELISAVTLFLPELSKGIIEVLEAIARFKAGEIDINKDGK